ncbi:hypothetical protein K5I29_04230 [Flavobacterium agricola]|uniref:Uncharacterized protein n=1 Tax=Flavobacterium agricola TaxID=2870839 RepID=A0ABY6M2W0_9FLAO|nr:hypothetical protein [Flavobacterium agricola]UYW02115.1 hypothetical protein K5I29_04230 [Flavobacterium agricola]
MENYPQYTDRVQYELYNDLTGAIIIQEPEGWQNDEKEYARNEEYFGVFAKFSNSLKFYGESKDLIQFIYDVQGIDAEVRLVKMQKHPKTDEWKAIYNGYLDLSTWEKTEDGSVSVKFNNGGLEKLIKNREKTNVEIDRADTLDGKDLPPLKTIEVMLDGREVFLHSKWKTTETENRVTAGVRSDDGNTRDMTTGIPISLDVRSHEQSHSVLHGSEGSEFRGSAGMMMLAVFDRDRTINIQCPEFKFIPKVTDGYYGVTEFSWAVIYICLSVYKYENSEYVLKERRPIWKARGGDSFPGDIPFDLVLNKQNSISFNEAFDVKQGDCISFEMFIKADLRNFGGRRARFNVELSEINGFMEVKEESQFPQTKTKAILAHELFERLSLIATNQNNAFYSEFFGRQNIGYLKNGAGAETAVTHGFWIRGFDKEPIPQDGPPKIENLFKPLTTSFKDALDSMSAIWGVGLGIETIGRKERIRIEDKKYFFNNNVTIKLPYQVKKVKRSVATSYYYSKLQHGFQKGGAYEEAYGLDEYNTILEHQTPITRLEKTFVNTSSYRADSYGMEFCRRKQREQNDTIDTNYDDNIWVMDLKRYNDQIYLQRKWQDDFEAAPTGIYSPNTATNLRFSPANSMQRHSWFFGGSFWKSKEKFVKYTSSTANSGMTTQMVGKSPIKENQDFLCNDFDRNRFVPEWIEFDHICDFEIMEQIEGTTVINGVEIPNVYGLVEFTNEDNQLEKGYLFSLKPNKEGKWKLLKSSR